MKYSEQIYQLGVIKTAVKQGEKERVKNAERIEKKNQIKNICLNCTKPECTSRCEKFTKKRRTTDERAD